MLPLRLPVSMYLREIDSIASSCYILPGQRSSVVEQGTHKPLVGGSNPPAAIFIILRLL